MLATEERINMGEDVYTDAVSFSIRGKLKQFLKLKISRTKKNVETCTCRGLHIPVHVCLLDLCLMCMRLCVCVCLYMWRWAQ